LTDHSDQNDTQKTIEQQFQEKPDWKGKLKNALKKSSEDVTGFIARGKERTLHKFIPKFAKNKRDEDFPPPSPVGQGFHWDSGKLNFIALSIALVLIAWTGADLVAFFVEKWIPEPPVTRSRGGSFEGERARSFADYQVII